MHESATIAELLKKTAIDLQWQFMEFLLYKSLNYLKTSFGTSFSSKYL